MTIHIVIFQNLTKKKLQVLFIFLFSIKPKINITNSFACRKSTICVLEGTLPMRKVCDLKVTANHCY